MKTRSAKAEVDLLCSALDCHLPAVAQGKEVQLGQADPKVPGLLRSSETCMCEEFSTSLFPL